MPKENVISCSLSPQSVGSSHNVVNNNLKRSQKGLWSGLHSSHTDVSVFYLTTGHSTPFVIQKRQNQHLVDHTYILYVSKKLLFTFVVVWHNADMIHYVSLWKMDSERYPLSKWPLITVLLEKFAKFLWGDIF